MIKIKKINKLYIKTKKENLRTLRKKYFDNKFQNSWQLPTNNPCRMILRRLPFAARIKTRSFSTDPNVVIIGAGLSGLKCAEHLIQNGVKNVKVLEASERIGGRIRTVQFGDSLCELGAKSIVVDQSNDSLYTKFNMKSKKRKPNQSFVLKNGIKESSKLTEMVSIAFQSLFCSKEIGDIEKSDKYINKDAKNYLDKECENLSKVVFKRNQESALKVFRTLTKEFSGFMGSDLSSVYVRNLPLICQQYFNSIQIETGMNKLVQNIQEKLPLKTIETGKPVTNIIYGDHPVVICADGRLFQADHIVCTIPLGALKNFNTFMFRPELPSKKTDAINCLGYGIPCKVFLEYKDDFSSWFDGNCLKLLWNPGEDIDRSDWTRSIVQFTCIPQSKRVLEVTIGASFCDEISNLRDEQIIQDSTEILKSFTKKKNIPFPVSVLRSNWSKDSLYLGGQPYLTTYCGTNKINDLSEPIFQGDSLKLLFAGDSTSVKGFGSLDGAYRSGLREAQRIIDYNQNVTFVEK